MKSKYKKCLLAARRSLTMGTIKKDYGNLIGSMGRLPRRIRQLAFDRTGRCSRDGPVAARGIGLPRSRARHPFSRLAACEAYHKAFPAAEARIFEHDCASPRAPASSDGRRGHNRVPPRAVCFLATG